MPPYNIQKRDSVKLQNIDDMDGLRSNLSHEELIRHQEGVSEGGGGGNFDGVMVVPQQQRRRPSGDDDGAPADEENRTKATKGQILTVAILCYVNLINYMDRFTVAGVLLDIQESFKMSESQSGLLQTAFVLVYMIMAPLFGYLGDRFSRKILMAVGISFWCLATLVGSFMPHYGLFLLFRCFVGVGEASYSTIAPTIISDLFVKDLRSKMLTVFYFAIPVGSGLGYIIGAEVKKLVAAAGTLAIPSEAWRYGLRVTPAMGLLAVLLIIFVMEEPERGGSEGGQHLQATSFWNDLKYLFSNKSFILSTLAFTCVTFVAGALAWWGPLFTELGVKIQEHPNSKVEDVAFIFGAIAMTAGIVGVPLGSFSGQKLRSKFPFADPVVCGTGLLLSFPLLMGAMYLAQINTIASYIVVFFGQLFLNMNWAVVSDIVLYVVIPTRRSSAEAFQILFSHALGDAGSPYLIGVVAEVFKPYIPPRNETLMAIISPQDNTTFSTDLFNETSIVTTTTPEPEPEDLYVKFKSLQYSMYICAAVNIFGALFFYINACYISADKEECDRTIAGEAEDEEASSNSSRSISTPEDPEEEQTQNLLT
ncbi:protein spinster-like isoform X2 [Palaemon carinicauda]|uniref:protein spinster-like isoform X2 n=1 Tax=Palaemon carinicauda TaxID=392227 RepID=UPI0035B5FBBF